MIPFLDGLLRSSADLLDEASRQYFIYIDLMPKICITIGIVVAYFQVVRDGTSYSKSKLFVFAITHGWNRYFLQAAGGFLGYTAVTHVIVNDLFGFLCVLPHLFGLLLPVPALVFSLGALTVGYATPRLYFYFHNRISNTTTSRFVSVIFPPDLISLINSIDNTLLAIERDIGKDIDLVYSPWRVADLLIDLPQEEIERISCMHDRDRMFDVLRIRNEGRRLKYLLEYFGPHSLYSLLDQRLDPKYLVATPYPTLSNSGAHLIRALGKERVHELYQLAKAGIIERRRALISNTNLRLVEKTRRPPDPDETARIIQDHLKDLELNYSREDVAARVLIIEFSYAAILTAAHFLQDNNLERASATLQLLPEIGEFTKENIPPPAEKGSDA